MNAQSTGESEHRDKLRKLYRMWQKGMVDEAAYIAARNDFYALRAENRSAAKLQKEQASSKGRRAASSPFKSDRPIPF